MPTRESPMNLRRLFPLALLAAAWPVFAAGSDVIGENLLWLAIIILAARLFAPLAQRVGFPAVLGELLLGVVLGNLGLLGVHYFDRVAADPIVAFLAELGVIVLLLQIGLETRLDDGRTVYGVGMNPNIVTASLKAVVSAANRAKLGKIRQVAGAAE